MSMILNPLISFPTSGCLASYHYWRIYITAGDVRTYGLVEMEWKTHVGGADITNNATPGGEWNTVASFSNITNLSSFVFKEFTVQ